MAHYRRELQRGVRVAELRRATGAGLREPVRREVERIRRAADATRSMRSGAAMATTRRRVFELRALAQQTLRGEVPPPPDDQGDQ